jgi:transposase
MNLFGDSDYLEKLSSKGDPLERLEKVVDFECFRSTLNRIFKYDLKNKSHGSRPPYDLVLMLKILILQRLYNLSDDAMEYQMIDRISFRRFLKIDDKVPDVKTIWNFRNQLSKSNRGNWLFSAFQEKLESQGMIAHKGQIVDATFIEAPNQRNPKDENELIKANRVPVNWTKNKRAQKDTAACWIIKGNERH